MLPSCISSLGNRLDQMMLTDLIVTNWLMFNDTKLNITMTSKTIFAY